MAFAKKLVISISGKLISSNGQVQVEFLKKFNKFLRENLLDGNTQIFVVVGGGEVSHSYRSAGKTVLGHELNADDLDWLGIHATKLNAHLVRTIFRDIAHPFVLKHYEIIRKIEEPLVVAGGWKPGWSTDFCKTILCEDYKVKTIINLTSTPTLFDKDPRKFKDAHPISHTTWKEVRGMVGDKWTPNMDAPFDPIAAKKAQELGLKVVILKGDDFENLKNYLDGKEFAGTVISG
ncbi:MAG: UMP kinase [Candidatus Levyibacteriota bacterium]